MFLFFSDLSFHRKNYKIFRTLHPTKDLIYLIKELSNFQFTKVNQKYILWLYFLENISLTLSTLLYRRHWDWDLSMFYQHERIKSTRRVSDRNWARSSGSEDRKQRQNSNWSWNSSNSNSRWNNLFPPHSHHATCWFHSLQPETRQ